MSGSAINNTEEERFYLSEEELQERLDKLVPTEKPTIPILRKFEEKSSTATTVLVVGMAGSGKSTLMGQLFHSLSHPSFPQDDLTSIGGTTIQKNKSGYFINLDPATLTVPFSPNIDIRDTVDYKGVMKEHHLGPNGAIMTSLNLFATKFDQVISLLEKRADGDPSTLGAAPIEGSISSIASKQQENSKLLDYIVVDTPGQIEAFTWSASGSIISESLASTFPTVLAFVVDTPRCSASPNTFMSNMLYACSMLYRTRLPLVVVFNKTDVVPHTFATEWMTNYEAFQEALDEHSTESGYYGSLTRSLSLVLDEFYSTLRYVGVSAVTGDGIPDFWTAVDAAACDFYTDYIPDLKVRIGEQYAKKRAKERQNIDRLTRDMKEAKITQEK